jgi:hypothetical protein
MTRICATGRPFRFVGVMRITNSMAGNTPFGVLRSGLGALMMLTLTAGL